MYKCWRADLPRIEPLYGFLEAAMLTPTLKALGDDLEWVFDATTGGWHVYRVARRGSAEIEDELVLVCAVQERMDEPFPEGRPTAPHAGVIEWLKAHDFTEGGSLPLERALALAQERERERIETEERQRDEDGMEAVDAFAEEAEKVIVRHQAVGSADGRGHAYLEDRPKSPRIIVPMGG